MIEQCKFTLMAAALVAVVAAAGGAAYYITSIRNEREAAIKKAAKFERLYETQKKIDADLVNAAIADSKLRDAAAERSKTATTNKEAFRHAVKQTPPQSSRLSPGVDGTPGHPGDRHLAVDAVRVLNAGADGKAVDRASLGTEEGRAASAATCEAVGETLIDTQRMYHDLAARHSILADAICRSDSAPYNPGCQDYGSSSSSDSNSSQPSD